MADSYSAKINLDELNCCCEHEHPRHLRHCAAPISHPSFNICQSQHLATIIINIETQDRRHNINIVVC